MNTLETQPDAQAQESPETNKTEQGEVRSDFEFVRNEAQRKIDWYLQDIDDPSERIDVIDRKIRQQQRLAESSQADEQHEIEAYQQWIDGMRREHGSSFFTEGFLQRGITEIQDNYAKYREQSPVILEILNQTRENLGAPSAIEEPAITAEPIELAEEIAQPEEAPAPEPLIMPEETEAEEKKIADLQEEQEPEETVTEQKEIKLDADEIVRRMRQNRELAEDIRNISARLRNIARDVSPRDPWYRPLQRFDEEFIGKLNNGLLNIINDAGGLRNVSQAVELNDPRAAIMLHKINKELSDHWHRTENILADGTSYINLLKGNTNTLLNGNMDRNHPVYQAFIQLNRANEEMGNRRRML